MEADLDIKDWIYALARRDKARDFLRVVLQLADKIAESRDGPEVEMLLSEISKRA